MRWGTACGSSGVVGGFQDSSSASGDDSSRHYEDGYDNPCEDDYDDLREYEDDYDNLPEYGLKPYEIY